MNEHASVEASSVLELMQEAKVRVFASRSTTQPCTRTCTLYGSQFVHEDGDDEAHDATDGLDGQRERQQQQSTAGSRHGNVRCLSVSVVRAYDYRNSVHTRRITRVRCLLRV
jgi:hypothetical protein